MDFEEALSEELSAILGVENKVFPLSANEGEKPPFIIYVSSEGKETMTMEGYHDTKEIGCIIHIVTQHYHQLKPLTKQVISKLQSFYGRQIGTNGPYVKSFTYDEPTEVHEEEVNYSRCSFDIRVRI
jgi:hypothetical protein